MVRHLELFGVCLLTLSGGSTLGADEPLVEIRQKSVTVYPIVVTPSKDIPASFPMRVAEVVGLFLERGGMESVEIGDVTFSPPDTDDATTLAAAFGEFIAKQPLKTEYALFCQMFGTPKTGPQEIRTVVVDKTGKVIFAERAGQKLLSRSTNPPNDPMTASVFVVNRVRTIWQLADPLREGAPEGKMAQIMRERSGLPPDEELAAMHERLKSVKDKIAASTVTVYPVHLWQGSDESSAVQLARMLNEQGICQAKASATDAKIRIAGDPNEQKVLWDTARSFREFVRRNPPETQYALLADYGLSPSTDATRSANHVHLVLCDPAGDWVLVDYQNSHHPDFQSVDPKSRDDCNRLAVLRLKHRLSE